MRLHKERVGDKLTEETECPSWDCDLKFNDRIELNRHFLENHDAEAIPCVYCVRLLQRDRIRQHIRNEHPHMSHLCTECGRECIYPSALKQHIKGKIDHLSDFIHIYYDKILKKYTYHGILAVVLFASVVHQFQNNWI